MEGVWRVSLRLGSSAHAHTLHTYSRTHFKINACISLQASVLEAEAGDGNRNRKPLLPPDRMGKKNTHQYAQFPPSLRSHSHTNIFTCPLRNQPHHIHTKTSQILAFQKKSKNTKHEAVQTRSHTIAFSIPCPTYKVKKETKINSTNIYFPVCF